MDVFDKIEDGLTYVKKFADAFESKKDFAAARLELFLAHAETDKRYAKQREQILAVGNDTLIQLRLSYARNWIRQLKIQPDAKTWMENNLALAQRYAQQAGKDISKEIEEILALARTRMGISKGVEEMMGV
jgi:hypothetical protein